MNKFFKITAVAVVTFTAAGVFAAPPKPHKHNNGVRLTADIINLVDCSLRLLTGTPQTVTVVTPPPPVVVAPPPPVYTTPVYTPAPIVIKTPPPRHVIINHRPAPPPKPEHHKPNRHTPCHGHKR